MTDINADTLVEKLLDAYEAKPNRVRPPFVAFPDKVNGRFISSEAEYQLLRQVQTFAGDAKAEYQLLRQLQKFADADAIAIRYGSKETAHRPTSIVLLDADIAYGLLGRECLDEKYRRVEAKVHDVLGHMSTELDALLRQALDNWRQKKGFLSIKSDAVDSLIAFMRCVDAVRAVPENPPDMRTYSRRFLGDSKLLENNMSRLSQYLIETDGLPEEMAEQEVLAHYGLEKFQHPVLVAGAFFVDNIAASLKPYSGIPWESVQSIRPSDDVATVITIENFASFNRYVREVSLEKSIVIYTAGFPSKTVQVLLSQLGESTVNCCCYHWGDIDPSGLYIADIIYGAWKGDFQLWQMNEIDAERGDKKSSCVFKRKKFNHASIQVMAEYLSSERAHWLEQEELDPVSPLRVM